jgi:hypothetical protein
VQVRKAASLLVRIARGHLARGLAVRLRTTKERVHSDFSPQRRLQSSIQTVQKAAPCSGFDEEVIPSFKLRKTAQGSGEGGALNEADEDGFTDKVQAWNLRPDALIHIAVLLLLIT